MFQDLNYLKLLSLKDNSIQTFAADTYVRLLREGGAVVRNITLLGEAALLAILDRNRLRHKTDFQ